MKTIILVLSLALCFVSQVKADEVEDARANLDAAQRASRQLQNDQIQEEQRALRDCRVHRASDPTYQCAQHVLTPHPRQAEFDAKVKSAKDTLDKATKKRVSP